MSLAFDANVDLAVDFEFGAGPLDAGLTYPDDLAGYFRGARWARGRPSTQGPFPAGRGILYLDNSGGEFYSFETGSPFYPNVTSGVPFRIQATHSAVDYGQVYGYIESWEAAFPTNREEIIAVPFVETYARMVRKTRSYTIAAETTDERIDSLLDAGGWPAARRNLDAGLANVAALDDEESTVEFRLNETAIVEQGSVYQDREGNIRFRNRVAYSGVTPLATFGPTAPDLVYTDVTYTDNEDLLYNEARVSVARDVVVTVLDAASQAIHGPITYPQIDSIEIPNSAVALNVAEWIVGKHQGLNRRVNGLTIDPAGDPANLWPVALSLDLRDAITVEIEFPGAVTPFSQTLSIERVSVAIEVDTAWTVDYTLHPLSAAEQGPFFQLDVSELDGTHYLA